MIKGIDLSDLILRLLLFDIKTLIIGSVEPNTELPGKTQKNKILITQDLRNIFLNLNVTLFKKQMLNLPKFD